MKEGKLWLLAFADEKLAATRRRIARQANAMRTSFEGGIRICSEKDLSEEFVSRMGGWGTFQKRGFGYWSWKPWLILDTLEKMPDGDVLLYVDAGCHLNKRGVAKLDEYRKLTLRYGILAFQARSADEGRPADPQNQYYLERCWTKGDLIDYFGVRDRSDILDVGQLLANVMFLKKSDATVSFVSRWLEVFFNHMSLCDDTPSISPNLLGFVAHRWDQSVYSLIGKLSHVKTLSGGELSPISSFMPPDADRRCWSDGWWQLRHNPILAMHDKGGMLYRLPLWLRAVIRFAAMKLAGLKC